MEMLLIVSVLSFVACGLWRVQDGWSNKKLGKLSNGVGLALPFLIITAVASSGGFGRDDLLLIAPAGLSSWLMIKGMPGWDQYLPHVNASGKEMKGMLQGYALYPAVMGAGLYIMTQDVMILPWALSALIMSVVYVEGSRIEKKKPLPIGTAAEFWGPLSYGFIGLGLALL